jgi:hypothetical protein
MSFLGCWNKGFIEQFENEKRKITFNSKPIPSNNGQYELKCSSVKFSDSAFFGG